MATLEHWMTTGLLGANASFQRAAREYAEEYAAMAIAAERARWCAAALAALEILDALPPWQAAGHACILLRECLVEMRKPPKLTGCQGDGRQITN